MNKSTHRTRLWSKEEHAQGIKYFMDQTKCSKTNFQLEDKHFVLLRTLPYTKHLVKAGHIKHNYFVICCHSFRSLTTFIHLLPFLFIAY